MTRQKGRQFLDTPEWSAPPPKRQSKVGRSPHYDEIHKFLSARPGQWALVCRGRYGGYSSSIRAGLRFRGGEWEVVGRTEGLDETYPFAFWARRVDGVEEG